jgi:hypothetical protein
MLGRWEISGPPVMMKILWKMLEILADDLELALMPKYMHLDITVDRERIEQELQGEAAREPQISEAEKLRRELFKFNQVIREKRQKKIEDKRKKEEDEKKARKNTKNKKNRKEH